MKRENLQAIHVFVTVVETGNFSAAAIQLGMTRSRVSQVISQLEKRVAVQLIIRSTRSMHLTEAGQHFYEQCHRGLGLIDSAIAQTEEDQTEIGGIIRINSLGGLFGERILTPHILKFMIQNPHIKIELDFSSNQVDLIADHFDFAIRMGELQDSSLIARPLVTYESYLCASPKYLQKYGEPEHPRDLNKHKLLTGSPKKWRIYKQKSNPQEPTDISVEGVLNCPNGHVVRKAALENLGVAHLPAYYVAEDVQQGKLQRVLPEWWHGQSKISIVYPQTRFKIRRVQLLVDYLLEGFLHTE